MSLLRNIAGGLRSLLRKKQVDRELNEELGAYLDMAAAEKMKQGAGREEALQELVVWLRFAESGRQLTEMPVHELSGCVGHVPDPPSNRASSFI